MEKHGDKIYFDGSERFAGSLDASVTQSEVGATLKRLDGQADAYLTGGVELIERGARYADEQLIDHGKVLLDMSKRAAFIACRLSIISGVRMQSDEESIAG